MSEETSEEQVVEETVDTSTPNALDMSDDAFNELLASGDMFDDTPTETEEVVDESDTGGDTGTDESEAEEDEEESEDETTEDMEVSTEEDEGEDVTEDEATEEVESKEIDYMAEYKKLTAPFKANGKDMQVDSIDDARSLMQMGANYNKKMAQLKPNLKLMKMLDNNGLLDEEKLNYLIDLDKKNPDAILKLVKDSKVDPMELDVEKDINYKPNTYTVNDKEVDLDDTLNDIKDTDSYAETLNIISNKWDESSKKSLLENPSAIKVLNEHVQMGIYNKIANAVETEKMFGRIPVGMSDLEAYKLMGDAINARGGFNAQPPSTSEPGKKVSKTTKKVVDPKLKDKKKAASSTKSSPKAKAKESFNPLSMSDEDFEKVGMSKFI
jgi:hypothetical protein